MKLTTLLLAAACALGFPAAAQEISYTNSQPLMLPADTFFGQAMGVAFIVDSGFALRWRGQSHPLLFAAVELELADTTGSVCRWPATVAFTPAPIRYPLLGHAEGGAFLANLARRARKHYLGLVTLSQQLEDFTESEHGQTVLQNAAMVLLLKQKAESIGAVDARFRLTAEERQLLLGADKGEGLLLVSGRRLGSLRIPLQVVALPPRATGKHLGSAWGRSRRGVTP